MGADNNYDTREFVDLLRQGAITFKKPAAGAVGWVSAV